MFCQCLNPIPQPATGASRYATCQCGGDLDEAAEARRIRELAGATQAQIPGTPHAAIPVPHVLSSRILAPDHLKPGLYGHDIFDTPIDISKEVQDLVQKLTSKPELRGYINELCEYQQLCLRPEEMTAPFGVDSVVSDMSFLGIRCSSRSDMVFEETPTLRVAARDIIEVVNTRIATNAATGCLSILQLQSEVPEQPNVLLLSVSSLITASYNTVLGSPVRSPEPKAGNNEQVMYTLGVYLAEYYRDRPLFIDGHPHTVVFCDPLREYVKQAWICNTQLMLSTPGHREITRVCAELPLYWEAYKWMATHNIVAGVNVGLKFQKNGQLMQVNSTSYDLQPLPALTNGLVFNTWKPCVHCQIDKYIVLTTMAILKQQRLQSTTQKVSVLLAEAILAAHIVITKRHAEYNEQQAFLPMQRQLSKEAMILSPPHSHLKSEKLAEFHRYEKLCRQFANQPEPSSPLTPDDIHQERVLSPPAAAFTPL